MTIKNKRAELTITKLVINLLIVIGIFTFAFNFLSENTANVGVTIDEKYSDVYNTLETERNSLDSNIQDIKRGVVGIEEAEASKARVAWNGLVGIGAAIKLPIAFIGSSWNIMNSLFGLKIIDGTLILILSIAIIAIIVLLILAALKGEAKL